MINMEKLKPVLVQAEQGDAESIAVVNRVLRPMWTDSIEVIEEKIRIFIRLNYYSSLTYKDAPFHREIDNAFAEQIKHLLTTGRPRYKVLIIIGYRESAKTTRVKMNQTYFTLYLREYMDYVNIVSEDGATASQFTMDMYNTFAFSKVSRYFPDLIAGTKPGQKQAQTMSKFTTTDGVTFAAAGARKSKRGAMQLNIDETGEIQAKRPKQGIFDDIENETTIRSLTTTQHIRSVMNSTIDGLDQTTGWAILLGNYLSLRGNVAYFLNKYRDSDEARIITIPIEDSAGQLTWPEKYCHTDKEERQLLEQGISRISLESIKRKSSNYETEYLNNPSRSRVYFRDDIVAKIDENRLVEDDGRDEDGLLVIEEPTRHDRYVIGVDGAKGNGGHHSGFAVFKIKGLFLEEVANYRNNTISPENFTPFMLNVANRYNFAFVVIERNYPGNEIIYIAKKSYKHLYIDEREEFGVHTNLRTKPDMFVAFKTLLGDGALMVRSRALYNQVLEYPADDVNAIVHEDDGGGHFDLLMSAVVGASKAQRSSEQQIDYQYTDAIMEDMFSGDAENNL